MYHLSGFNYKDYCPQCKRDTPHLNEVCAVCAQWNRRPTTDEEPNGSSPFKTYTVKEVYEVTRTFTALAQSKEDAIQAVLNGDAQEQNPPEWELDENREQWEVYEE